MQCLHECPSLPKGVVNSVNEQGTEVGEALVALPDVDVISFTGSSATGKRIMAAAAPTLKRLLLELGGKAPAVVFADAELDTTVRELTLGALTMAGQICVAAARFLLESGVPAPFRIHDKPPESKYADLVEFLKEFSLRMPAWARVKPKDFANLLRKVRDRPDAALLESVLLRSQSLAVYSPDNLGHFGLALEAYAHFTSPIRRYPDLLVHRAIKHALRGGRASDYLYSATEMAALALQCSERERRADEAEREVDERYRAAWMEQHVGSRFEGVISGVTSFGLFVELVDSKVTGLVHVTQLPHDYYHFDPVRKTLTGERRGREFRLGDRVRILVLKASVEDRRIDFRLAEDEEAPAPRGRRRRG